MSQIKAIYFDVANTLLQKQDLIINIDSILKLHGYTIPINHLERIHKQLSEIILFPDKTSFDFYQNFNKELLCSLSIVPNEEIIKDIFKACTYLPWSPFEDLKILDKIEHPKGVISNWDTSLPEKLSINFPNVHFGSILGSELKGFRKPNLKFYEIMIEESGLKPKEILYIGDSFKLDIIPAKSLGVTSILIDRLNIYPYTNVLKIRNMNEIERWL